VRLDTQGILQQCVCAEMHNFKYTVYIKIQSLMFFLHFRILQYYFFKEIYQNAVTQTRSKEFTWGLNSQWQLTCRPTRALAADFLFLKLINAQNLSGSDRTLVTAPNLQPDHMCTMPCWWWCLTARYRCGMKNVGSNVTYAFTVTTAAIMSWDHQ